MAIMQSSVVELCPAYPDKVAKYSTEIFVSETFKIPAQKPPKEQIVNVDRKIELVDVQTVQVTLPGTPVPLQPNPGNKVFVAGNIYLGVQYSALREDQKVHFVRFQLPYQTIILNDCELLIDPADTMFTNGYVVHVCVEKEIITQIDERTISAELLLLIWVDEIA
ncbi:MAG: hypothetical protein CVU87_01180 [Firmicutes bacterium HGW-Firmicutes-12]|jgi:hypothetical protein|nr:MAG: hypothetical protein CVU87_01180 [Firmicutes bacterium HGW-Firmicutes-12]